jgi:N-methylhydantoinase A
LPVLVWQNVHRESQVKSFNNSLEAVEKKTLGDRWWVGIDVGGTFTDAVAVNLATGELVASKELTTPDALETGVFRALEVLPAPICAIDEIVHGHTAGINAVLSRSGAVTGLLATAGHRDLLDIGRMDREFGPRLYDPTWVRPHQERPIIRRANRFPIPERIAWDGSELLPLDEAAVREAAIQFKMRGVESVAICFLNSYLCDDHERRAAEIVHAEYPEAYIQTSRLYPVTKEHERTVTVALDAYVGPLVTHYLTRLASLLRSRGFQGSLWIMTMNGGVASLEASSKAPVFQLVSGPVGGVAGATFFAEVSGTRNLLTMDVGGTSTDVSAIIDGTTPLTDLWTVEHGLTLTMPVVDVASVGSGGGSIIHVDPLGGLRVGPQSAGSVPGPAAYDRGGTEPTLTDACVVLGILQSDLFAGGKIKLDAKKARDALKPLAGQFGMPLEEFAEGAVELACLQIASSIRQRSTYRGLDVREFSLLAFGSAGPMLAAEVARHLGVAEIVVPLLPGEFSALGLLATDLRLTQASSPMKVLESYEPERLESEYRALERRIRGELIDQGADANNIVFERAFYAMYSGQTWHNRLLLTEETVTRGTIGRMHQQLHDYCRDNLGFSAEGTPVLITTLEVSGISKRASLDYKPRAQDPGDPVLKRAHVRFGGVERADVPFYARNRLVPGFEAHGPAIIVDPYATITVPIGATAVVDPHGFVRIAIAKEA